MSENIENYIEKTIWFMETNLKKYVTPIGNDIMFKTTEFEKGLREYMGLNNAEQNNENMWISVDNVDILPKTSLENGKSKQIEVMLDDGSIVNAYFSLWAGFSRTNNFYAEYMIPTKTIKYWREKNG